jgi:hypothetical protein
MHGRAAILLLQNREQPMRFLWAFHSNAPEDGRFPIEVICVLSNFFYIKKGHFRVTNVYYFSTFLKKY